MTAQAHRGELDSGRIRLCSLRSASAGINRASQLAFVRGPFLKATCRAVCSQSFMFRNRERVVDWLSREELSVTSPRLAGTWLL
jgi:hypothetical protein